MKIATLCFCALLLLVVGCSPDEQGTQTADEAGEQETTATVAMEASDETEEAGEVKNQRENPREAENEKEKKASIDAIDLNVLARKTVEIMGDETPIDAANVVLSRLSRYAEKRGKKAATISVRITVDDLASYGDFRRVVQACQENRFGRFVLQCGTDSYPFSAPLAAPAEGLPNPDMLPPLKVRLKAGRAGELAHISLNDNNLGTNFESLHNYIISILGDERGPGSVAEAAEVELHCDDALKFKYVAEAYRSVSYFVDSSGTRVTLIKKVWPLGSPHGVEIEELEEFEEILGDPMDIVPEVVPVEPKEKDGPDLSIDR